MTVPVEIPPGPFPGRPRRTFEIRRQYSAGAVIGSIQADTFAQAAHYASKQFFNGSGATTRATGSHDAPGLFLDTSEGRATIMFWIGEPGVIPPEPPPPTPLKLPPIKPQPKRKCR
jgi:hypothetical protein